MVLRAPLRTLLLALALLSGPLEGATLTVYGLEEVKFQNLVDPSVRSEFVYLVSGSLKLVGTSTGTWEAVTYIPDRPTARRVGFVPPRTAAPTSDRGMFRAVGNRITFYSLLTFAGYRGVIVDDGEQIVVTKVNRLGQSQTETWYLGR